MSEYRGSVLVGAFVVGAVVIAFAGALFFAGGGFGGERSKVVMAFDGSLHGLTIGAPIALRGVTVGQITDIDLLLDGESGSVTMAVMGEIDPNSMQISGSVGDSIHDELVARGLRAQLNTQSLLTGLLYVQLDFHPDTQVEMKTLENYPYPQIPTIPTELEQLRQTLESIDYSAIVANIDRIASGLDSLLNSEQMQALPASLQSSLASIEAASTRLDATLADTSPRLAQLLDEGNTTLATLNSRLPEIGDNLNNSLASLDTALASASATLQRIEDAAAPDSGPRRQMSRAMHDLSLAARSLRSLARTLEENPQALLRGRTEAPQ